MPDLASARVCPTPTDPCVAELLCESSTGECTGEVYVDSGVPCEVDGNPCTLDACDSTGTCVALGDLDGCADERREDPCWTYTCNAKSGCDRGMFLEGGPCDDGDSCTIRDTCGYTIAGEPVCAGAAVPVDDADPCTADYCAGGAVFHDPVDGPPCESDDPCGTVGECVAGECVADTTCECDEDEDCARPDDLCAGIWRCDTSGDVAACVLVPGSAVSCEEDPDACMERVCEPATGECVERAAANGGACDDGDACTFDDTCEAGSCVGGPAVGCDDEQFCNGVETCDSSTGCVPGVPPSLDDNVTCTADSCDELADEIVHDANDDACTTDAPCRTVACVPAEGGCVISLVASCCGNGVLEDDEECDDDNADEGDGCSALCVVEGATPVGDLTSDDPGRWSDGSVALACREYRFPPAGQTAATADGVYVIDPDGPGAVSGEFAVYCDMQTDGGGWTLIHKTDKSSASDHTDEGYNVAGLTSPALDGVAVLPRAILALFGRGTFRMLTTRAAPNDRIYYRNGPFYTTYNHFNDFDGDQENDVFEISGKRSWSDAWGPVDYLQAGGHSIHIGVTTPYYASLHIGANRYDQPGFWVNVSPASATGSHYSGTTWVW